jgi:hypothetical protein
MLHEHVLLDSRDYHLTAKADTAGKGRGTNAKNVSGIAVLSI